MSKTLGTIKKFFADEEVTDNNKISSFNNFS